MATVFSNQGVFMSIEFLHLDFFLAGLVSLLVITNPPSKIPLFISLTQGMDLKQRKSQALWASIYAAIIMFISLLAGNLLLAAFGISYGALRIAGGFVVAVIGYRMLFGEASPNKAPLVRRDREDYAFFPIAMPMISGPGTMAVLIGFSTEIAEFPTIRDQVGTFFMMTLAIIFCCAVCWMMMRSANFCAKVMGPSGTVVLSKVMGFLLICIGVQFLGSGIRTFLTGA